MRNDIGKKLFHFFMVNHSSLLALILYEIALGFLLLSKLELLIDYFIQNLHRVPHKKGKRPLLLAIFFVFTFQWISEYIGQKIAKSNGLLPFLRDTLYLFFMKSSINNSSLDCREKTHATSCNIKARRELWLTMKKWHNFLPISFLMKSDHISW